MIIVQYLPCGHDDYSDDPEHIKKDQERAAKGYLDALILNSSECEICKEEDRAMRARYAAYGIYLEDE